MKMHITSVLAALALGAVAAPAVAQTWDGRYDRGGRWEQGYDDDWGGNPWAIVDRVERRIERAYDNGRISGREHAMLIRQLRQLESYEHRYMRDGGLSRWERDDLQRRADWLEAQLREERRDGRDRGYR